MPTIYRFASWLLQEQNSGRAAFSDPQTLAQGLALAKGRADEMRALMQRDPAEFVRRSMPAADIDQFPPQLQSLVEKRVKGRQPDPTVGLPTATFRIRWRTFPLRRLHIHRSRQQPAE